MGSLISWFLTGLLFIVTFGVVVVIGGAAILIASALLKIVFAIGPFFILTLMFPITAHLFEKWLGKAMTYIFQIVLAAALMAIVVEVFRQIIGVIDLSETSNQNGLQVSIGVAATGLALYFLIKETAKMGSELGGGLAVEMMSATGLAQAALSPARTAGRMLNPTSSRLDPQTGHKVSGSRLEHLAYGRTMLNPSYRIGLIEQMNRGWKPLPKPGASASKRPTSGSKAP